MWIVRGAVSHCSARVIEEAKSRTSPHNRAPVRVVQHVVIEARGRFDWFGVRGPGGMEPAGRCRNVRGARSAAVKNLENVIHEKNADGDAPCE